MKRLALALYLSLVALAGHAQMPPSGTITFAQLQAEFGGSNPIAFNEYYRGGGLVPNIAANAAVPTSGTMSLSQFYNATAVVLGATLPTGACGIFGNNMEFVTSAPSMDPSATFVEIIFPADGTWYITGAVDPILLCPSPGAETWMDSATPADYDIMFDVLSGALDGSCGASGVWYNAGSSVSFCVHQPGVSDAQAHGTLHIRPAGGGSDLASATISLWTFYTP